MAIAQTLPTIDTEPKTEIIFPNGEFWSDEPPLESYLHLGEKLAVKLKELGIDSEDI